MDTARRYRVPSPSSPYSRASSENSGYFLVSVGFSPITAPHFLPKHIRSKGPSLHHVSGTSPVLCPSPTPARTSTQSAVVSRYLTCGSGLPRCIKHFPDMPSSLPRWIKTGAAIGFFPVLLRPSPNIGRVGFHIFTFEACSRFTHVTACRFAATRMVYFCLQCFSRKVSLPVCLDSYRAEPIITRTELPSVGALYPRGARRVEDGRGSFRFSVAYGRPFELPPQSDLP